LIAIYLKLTILIIFKDWTFLVLLPFIFLNLEEIFVWAKNGEKSEFSDIVFIFFFFFFIFFATKEFLTSIMGAFSIYLWMGVWELKKYPVINKILIISLITYTIIFITGIISFYLENPFFLNTAFAFSFWIILILGFILFGRKYIIVWRFMSPQYLTLFLYIIGWLAVVFIDQYTSINFLDYIYIVLIFVNILVYFSSGVFLDKLLGIKRIRNDNLITVVNDVKRNIAIKGKVKIGYGKYPILNAMAYGPFIDRRIAIIAENLNNIPEDELKGIVAHELAHTKGNHTLLLALITIADLLFRMLFGIPATIYDYTFGNPQIPFIYFILINIGIYIILYFFIRILEGFADLRAKRSGYQVELAKALYNLESFYATGREFGLNTMLLCEEKLTKENQMLDYIDTAKYLNKSMIKPSRISLLSNFLNSHPLTFHRLIAILNDDKAIKPAKEAILPIICLRRSKQRQYAKKFSEAREKIQKIATKKFKEFFNIENIAILCEDLKIKDHYQLALGREFLFRNLISKEIIIGKLIDIKFQDNVCDPENYLIQNLKTGKRETLSSSLYSRKKIYFNNSYYIDDKKLLMNNVELKPSETKGNYIFSDVDGNIIRKSINKTKLSYPLEFIESFEDQFIFLKQKGELQIYRCKNVKTSENDHLILELKADSESEEKQDKLSISIKDLIIFPQRVRFSITKNSKLKASDIKLLEWIKNHKIMAYFYLKKPVNNIEIGYLKNIAYYTVPFESKENNSEKDTEIIEITISTIFNKLKQFKLKELDFINFKYITGMIQKQSELSIFSKLFYKLVQKLRPEKVIFQ
jgi:Zn-dependent protease with chaperone function